MSARSIAVRIAVSVACALSGGALHAQISSLVASPTSLTFATAMPGTPVLPQMVSVASTGSALPFAVSIQYFGVSTGWLSATPATGQTPAVITINVDTTNLTSGTYSALVGITSGATQGTFINVTLQIGGSGTVQGLTATPASVSLSAPQYGAAVSQIVNISALNTLGGSLNISVLKGNPWLSVTPQFAFTPAAITISANPSGLIPGIYSGTVSAVVGSGYTLSIPVTFNVNPGGSGTGNFNVSPGSVSFSYQIGTPVPSPQSVLVSNPGFAVTYTATSSVPWLLLTTNPAVLGAAQAYGTTDSSLILSLNPSGLGFGQYTGTVSVTASNAITQYLQVTLNVGNSPFLLAQPSALSFAWQTTSTIPSPQGITIGSTSTALTYSSAVTSGQGWLNVSPSSGSTNSANTLTVSVYPYQLSAGTYTGTITVSSPGAVAPLAIPVTLTVYGQVTNGTFSVAPTFLSFQSQPGGVPQSQSLSVASPPLNVPFQATAQSGANWLTVTPIASTTPAVLTVNVNPTVLTTAGVYSGQIILTTPAGAATTVPVNITITSSSLTVTPAQLSFNYGSSGLDFTSQTVAVNSTGAALQFTAAASTTSGGSWLSVTPAAGTAPTSLNVSISGAAMLQPGTYQGSITVTPAGGIGSIQIIGVRLVVNATAPVPAITAILNGASLQPGSVAPGEMVTINGSNLGPAGGALVHVLSAGAVDSTISGTRVFFDDIAAPLLFASGASISAVVPYELYTQTSTRVHIEVNGVSSNTVTLTVADSSPAIFTIDGAAQGQGKILNQDGSINGPNNPASPGTIISLFMTGLGQTDPVGQDGRMIVTDLRTPLLPVTVMIAGQPAVIMYAGSAPGFVSGFMQVNARIPDGVASGSQTPIQVQAGGAMGPAGVTIAIQ